MTIPASQIVSSTPSVLGPGGLGISLLGTILTNGTRVPVGTMAPFADAADVSAYFGPSSAEADLANVYFGGYSGSPIKPSKLYYAQYNQDDVGAYLRGGQVTTLTLAQLGALSGSLTVLLDGYTHTAPSINLSGCSSYSNAASIIQTALFASEPTEATSSASTIAGTTLTVSGTLTGFFQAGQTLSGSGVTANSVILSQLSGTAGGAGTYHLSQSSTVGSPEAISAVATAGTVTFDSVAGAFVVASGITGAPSTAAFATGTLAAGIFLTEATGAVLSQGAAAASPGAFMTALTQLAQDWAVFLTSFDPDNGSGNSVKLAFALWASEQNDRWNYACWDNDASPTVTVPATSSLGYLLQQGNYDGTTLIYRTLNFAADAPNPAPGGAREAAFYAGTAASVDFTRRNGRITFAFKGQAGFTPDITNATVASNLKANGYNYYGDWATATQQFQFFYPGQISGQWKWADTYLNQIWLNTGIQSDEMVLLTSIGSVPYTQVGNDLIYNAALTTLQQAVLFGAMSPGVTLSALQQAEVVNAAGTTDVLTALFNQGFYFQIGPTPPTSRAARTTPPITLWYTDAGAVQQLNIASVTLE